jgi:hypothetical protein
MNTAQKIAEAVKSVDKEQQSDYNDVNEWSEAVSLLPDDVVCAIPFCVYDLKLDEMGAVVLEKAYDDHGRLRALKKDGSVDPKWEPKPVRWLRYDVFAILAWIAVKREEPDMTLAEMRELINGELFEQIHDDVMLFWGLDMGRLRAIQEDQEGEEATGEAGEDVDP